MILDELNAARAKERRQIDARATEQAERIIQRATGKGLSYYATRSRKEEFTAFRALYVYLAVELGASYVAAGRALGRSHATAIHAYNSYTLYATTWGTLARLRQKVIELTDTICQ